MTTWHQQQAMMRDPITLRHPTLWSAYNPAGHLSVMRFDSMEACMRYCETTGDVPLAPQGVRATT